MLSDKTVVKIKEAIEKFKLFLRYSTLGPHTLTTAQLRELARAGYIGEHAAPGHAIAEAYTTAHLDTSDNPSAVGLQTRRDGSIRYLERMAALYSDKAAEQLGADIMSTIETQFLPFFNRKEGKLIYDTLKDPQKHGKHLGATLRGQVKNWEYRYRTIVVTEQARAANWGAVDAIASNNKGKTPDEIFVYKQGTHSYAESCPDCQRFWFTPDGHPRLYKLSDLLEGGTNIGRKKADWKPTIDSTHPHCVHIVVELKPGFGWVSGALQYIGADHDEYKKQRNGSA